MGEHDTAGPLVPERSARRPSVQAPWEACDRDQARDEGADAPAPPAPPVCPRCGRRCERRPTYYGAYVLLEPDIRRPAHEVPVGHRWYEDSDGRVWNGNRAEPAPGAHCLVPHRVACPALVLLAHRAEAGPD
ncbi:DUF6083 domain-containing protein [Streptomyces sp. NPDC053493]|uniref:DUF6083 domain-containing protein n=1 Tax=Streptomyces sp. NPDC053493 TaxID=3365705 RepID=UPI0037D4A2D6